MRESVKMENHPAVQMLFPIEPERFIELLRGVVKEELHGLLTELKVTEQLKEESLLNRRQIAKKLDISLVTLNDWVNHGLPCSKQRGKVYFLYSEVLEYIKANRPKKYMQLV
jgi:hypothetical protein